jgi:microcompartment protein CcmL/EutN
MSKALAMIETRGMVAAIEAADAMVKAANVRIVGYQKADAGLITVLVEGDVGAVKAACDAGAVAGSKVGTVISAHVIARPDPQVAEVIGSGKPKPKPGPVPKPNAAARAKPRTRAKAIPKKRHP